MHTSAIKLVVVVLLLPMGCGREAGVPAPVTRKATETDDVRDLVSVAFSQPEYVFSLSEVAEGARIDYTISIDADIPHMMPRPQDVGGAEGEGPTGLYPFAEISGHGQSYSLRDVGLGPPPSPRTTVIRKGVYPLSFEWDGRNWTGPSDTLNPKGAPFPPGVYSLRISMVGECGPVEPRRPYRIESTVKVIVTEDLRAYWLSDTDPSTIEMEDPLLVISRVPLEQLEAIEDVTKLRGSLDRAQPSVVYILDEPAFFLETNKRDSVWNLDRQPIKPFSGAILDGKTPDTFVAFGRQYKISPAERADVIRLLENPEGSMPIHRKHAPLAGAEQTAKAIILLLKNQVEPSPAKGPNRVRAVIADRPPHTT